MPFTIKKIAMRLRNDSEYIPLPGVRGEAGPGVPAGGTTGQVLAKSSSTDYATTWVNAGGSASMTILSYGNSTWADFIAAYNANSIVYCRASSNADPSSGSQTRLAFMAYVSNASSPTSVEFQYYRSVSSHTDAQQGDQVYIYKLTSAGAWSVTVREAYTKIAAGTNMSSSYANGTLTLNATGGGGGTSDYDDLTDKPSINNVTLSGNKTAAELGLGTYSKPSTGIPQTDLAQTVQNKLDKTVVVSDTQPTGAENKLWVDTDAGAGTSYQIPTVAEMETADNTILGNLATIESSPATAAHAVGEYIVYNGQLYKVTSAIASGQTLTPGTNISSVNVGAELTTIQALQRGVLSFSAEFPDNGESQVLKCGKTVQLILGTENLSASPNNWVVIGTLPAGYRPITYSVFIGYDYVNKIPVLFSLMSNGTMRVMVSQSTTNVKLNIMFLAD